MHLNICFTRQRPAQRACIFRVQFAGHQSVLIAQVRRHQSGGAGIGAEGAIGVEAAHGFEVTRDQPRRLGPIPEPCDAVAPFRTALGLGAGEVIKPAPGVRIEHGKRRFLALEGVEAIEQHGVL